MVYRNFVQPERLLVNSKKKKNPEKDAEANSEPNQTSIIESPANIVKSFVLDVWLGSECASDI